MVDALVVVESRGDAAWDNVRRLDPLQVPVVYLAEVTSALRVLVQRGDLDDNGAYVPPWRRATCTAKNIPWRRSWAEVGAARQPHALRRLVRRPCRAA